MENWPPYVRNYCPECSCITDSTDFDSLSVRHTNTCDETGDLSNSDSFKLQLYFPFIYYFF